MEPVPARRRAAAGAARADGGGVRGAGLDLRSLVVRLPARRLDRRRRPGARPGPDLPRRTRAGSPARWSRRSRSSTACGSAPTASWRSPVRRPSRRWSWRSTRRPWHRPACCGARARWRSTRRGPRSPSRSRSRAPAGASPMRLFYRPTNPDVVGPGRGAAAARGLVARRPDGERRQLARPGDPAADEPRDRRRRRRLRRQHRLRARVPPGARWRRGASSTSTTAWRPRATWSSAARSTPSGWPSRAAAPAATRRSRPSPSATCSRPASACSGSATSRRSPRTRTSSSRATCDRLVGPYPEAADAVPRALADPSPRRDLVPGARPPGPRGPGRAAQPGRGDRRGPRGQRHPARLPRVRGRGPRLPRRGRDPPDPRGAARRSWARSSASTPADDLEPLELPGLAEWRARRARVAAR